MGEWIDDVDKLLSLSRRSSAGKHRPPRPAGKGYGDESSVEFTLRRTRLFYRHSLAKYIFREFLEARHLQLGGISVGPTLGCLLI